MCREMEGEVQKAEWRAFISTHCTSLVRAPIYLDMRAAWHMADIKPDATLTVLPLKGSPPIKVQRRENQNRWRDGCFFLEPRGGAADTPSQGQLQHLSSVISHSLSELLS